MTTARRGFSLVEMMVAMTITMAVFAITLPFVRAQTRSLGSTAGRMDADQVARFAMRAVEQDLRRAAGEYGQPMIVAAGAMVLSFNANLRRADSLDVAALETEVLGMAAGGAWPLASADSLPTTTRMYPVADYVNADGDTTRTETITYYLLADSGATDAYTLYRQYNDQVATALISGLYLPDSQVFFSYYRNVSGYLEEIPDDSVIFWTAPRMAEIRTIGLRASGRYVNKFDNSEFVRTIETRVTLPVSLQTTVVTCGATPAVPSSGLSVTVSTAPRGASLAWGRSSDDAGEPASAQHYIVERRPSGGAWSTVGAVNATGTNSYAFHDPGLTRQGTFEYGVRVVGCGGSVSARVSLGSVTL